MQLIVQSKHLLLAHADKRDAHRSDFSRILIALQMVADRVRVRPVRLGDCDGRLDRYNLWRWKSGDQTGLLFESRDPLFVILRDRLPVRKEVLTTHERM